MLGETPNGKSDRTRWVRIILYIIVALALMAVVLPNFMKARSTLSENACFVTQRNVLPARAAYVKRHRLKPTDSVYVTNLVKEGYLKEMPVCPVGGAYGPVFTVNGVLNCRYPDHDFIHFTKDLAERRLYRKFEPFLNHPGNPAIAEPAQTGGRP